MLYQEFDQALDKIKLKDQKLTAKMIEIRFWFVSRTPPGSAKLKMQDI